jgi:pantoate kinase
MPVVCDYCDGLIFIFAHQAEFRTNGLLHYQVLHIGATTSTGQQEGDFRCYFERTMRVGTGYGYSGAIAISGHLNVSMEGQYAAL